MRLQEWDKENQEIIQEKHQLMIDLASYDGHPSTAAHLAARAVHLRSRDLRHHAAKMEALETERIIRIREGHNVADTRTEEQLWQLFLQEHRIKDHLREIRDTMITHCNTLHRIINH